MLDSYGRNIDYLRLSLTERCNLKCLYCRDAQDSYAPSNEITIEEIKSIAKAMVELGIKKVRLTGGEPMVRHDLEQIIAIMNEHGFKDLSLTTNAQGLKGRAKGLKQAGLTRINISLDSLCKNRYEMLTRGGKIDEVLEGIDNAIECGLLPIKLNSVVIKGENDGEIDNFIALTKDRPIDVRFIELMPFGKFGSDPNKRISNSELIKARPLLIPCPPRYEGQPSEDFKMEGHLGRVGFISPISHKFCNSCNRIRVTSDAKLKPCLGNNCEADLREAIQLGNYENLLETIKNTIYNKPQGHNFEQGFDSQRGMSRIGG